MSPNIRDRRSGCVEGGLLVFRREERAAFEIGGVEAERRGLEGQSEGLQLLFDLIDGLHAEITDVEQILLRVVDQLADCVDALALEAVVAALRKVEVLNRKSITIKQKTL